MQSIPPSKQIISTTHLLHHWSWILFTQGTFQDCFQRQPQDVFTFTQKEL